jgi:hypothetical protein
MIKNIFTILISALILLISLVSCEADKISTDTSLMLKFSSDTVSFDTIFTEQGSATYKLKVYNPSKNRVLIESITLNEAENYRMNVSGISADVVNNTYLNAQDSLMIFIQVFIDPNDDKTPFIVRDSIDFYFNNHTQVLQLQAFGRNVKRFKNKTIASDTTITSEMPILVSDTLKIAEGATLTLTEGAKLYCQKASVILVEGTLVSQGKLGSLVEIRGDRDDFMNTVPPLSYDQASGQWGGIRIASSSFGNVLNHTDVRNADFGIVIDSTSAENTTLTVKNSIIRNMLYNVIHSVNAKVEIHNSLLYNAGENILRIEGGDYKVIHTTLTNNYAFSWGGRTQPILYYSNKYKDYILEFKAEMYNSIVHGNYTSEIDYQLDTLTIAPAYFFKNCIVKQYMKTVDSNIYRDCLINSSPKFVYEEIKDDTYRQYDYHLTSSSPAIGKADASITPITPKDLDGNERMQNGTADIGCYEYIQ